MRLTSVPSHLILLLSLVSTRPLTTLLHRGTPVIAVRNGEDTVATTDQGDFVALSARLALKAPAHYRSIQRRLSGPTIVKVTASAALLGALGLAFEESGRHIETINAPPDEGAFTPQQERVIVAWFQTKPTQLWEGDQVMQRIKDMPNVSRKEINKFATEWKTRQDVILNMTAVGNFTMTSGTHVPTNSEGLGSALAEADVHPSIVSQEITKSAVPEFQDNNRTTVPTVVTQGATGART